LAQITDEGVLATLVTVFLVRTGGSIEIDSKEWDAAVEHASTLYVHREEGGPVVVYLLGIEHRA